MHHDDAPVGHVLSRREAVRVLGAGSLLLVPGAEAWRRALRADQVPPPGCVVRPEQTAGPYFVDGMLRRADIRSDPATGAVSAGVPLALAIAVARVRRDACEPIPGAHVDVWQCDAAGAYSGVTDPYFSTEGKAFLRGWQLTDAGGVARFTTIYPGWYPERTVHIHFTIRTAPGAAKGHVFTSQLYFDDAVTDRVFEGAPYAARGPRKVRNDQDGIFRKQGGRDLLCEVTPTARGWEGTFAVGLVLDGA